MTVTAPGILAVLFAVVLAAAGGALVVVAARALRAVPGPAAAGRAGEPIGHLVLLLALLVATVSAAALLCWVLLLQGLVPQWADVRCLVGVLRVGTGSAGAAGWLPGLADTATALLLALPVAGGAAVAAHLAQRDRPEGPPGRAHLVALLGVGVLALAAAAAMTAWIAIPKEGRFLSAGCCTPAAMPLLGAQRPAGGGTTLYALGAAAVAVDLVLRRIVRRSGHPPRWLGLGGATLLLVGGFRVLESEVAPAALGLPLHGCTWCLLGEAPETAWGMALLAAPLLATLWGVAARMLGPGSGPTLERIDGVLDGVALFGLLGVPLFFAAERLAS